MTKQELQAVCDRLNAFVQTAPRELTEFFLTTQLPDGAKSQVFDLIGITLGTEEGVFPRIGLTLNRKTVEFYVDTGRKRDLKPSRLHLKGGNPGRRIRSTLTPEGFERIRARLKADKSRLMHEVDEEGNFRVCGAMEGPWFPKQFKLGFEVNPMGTSPLGGDLLFMEHRASQDLPTGSAIFSEVRFSLGNHRTDWMQNSLTGPLLLQQFDLADQHFVKVGPIVRRVVWAGETDPKPLRYYRIWLAEGPIKYSLDPVHVPEEAREFFPNPYVRVKYENDFPSGVEYYPFYDDKCESHQED